MTSTDKMIVIQAIARARGLNTKMDILQSNPELKGILKACYDPYIQYYVKPTENWITAVGTEVFSSSTSALLHHLSKRTYTGNAAKKAVMNELNKLEPLSQTLLMRILNKDMRCGMQAKTINKVFPGCIPEFAVQLAKLYEPGKMPFPCIGSYKVDGLRGIFENGHFYSRRGNLLVGLDHLANALNAFPHIRFDGEIIVPGKTFDDISGDIRAFKESDNAVYMIFDAHSTTGDLPLHNRVEVAHFVVAQLKHPQIRFVEHRTLRSEAEAYDMYEEARALGYEGLVLKREGGLPYNGRNNDWMKLKPKDTVDLLVTGVEAGNGKYSEMVGTLACEYNDVTVHVGGGLSDHQRSMWWSDPDLIVGKTIEVEYMELSKEGRLRHPRFKSIRGDK